MKPLYRNRDWLIQKHEIEKLSIRQMANLLGVDKTTIAKWMDKLQVPRRNHDQAMHNFFSKQHSDSKRYIS